MNKGYNPHKNEQWQTIKILWNLYKSEFDLEGDLYMRLKKSNTPENEINRQIQERRIKVANNIEAWRQLGRERI